MLKRCLQQRFDSGSKSTIVKVAFLECSALAYLASSDFGSSFEVEEPYFEEEVDQSWCSLSGFCCSSYDVGQTSSHADYDGSCFYVALDSCFYCSCIWAVDAASFDEACFHHRSSCCFVNHHIFLPLSSKTVTFYFVETYFD